VLSGVVAMLPCARFRCGLCLTSPVLLCTCASAEERKKGKTRSQRKKTEEKKRKKEKAEKSASDSDAESVGSLPDESKSLSERPISLLMSNQFGMVEKTLLKPGAAGARRPKRGEQVTMHCVGTLDRPVEQGGKVFWSTRDKYEKAYSFEVGTKKVIEGWDQGALSMALGEKSRFVITPNFAYGVHGFPQWNIPGGATLVMEFELLKIEKSQTEARDEKILRKRAEEKKSHDEVAMRKKALKVFGTSSGGDAGAGAGKKDKN